MNGRLTGIDISQFESDKGVAQALDSETGETVILKAAMITKMAHLKTAKEEAETLRQLGRLFYISLLQTFYKITSTWCGL